MLDDQVVWMQFSSQREAEEVLLAAADRKGPSPFSLLERWMELLGSPPSPLWVTVKGMPLQAWHEETFGPIGNCFSRTMEVGKRT